MEKRIVFRFSFFNLKNEKRKTNRFSFILLHFLHVKCNCGIVHAPKITMLHLQATSRWVARRIFLFYREKGRDMTQPYDKHP